jgi:adenosylcobinamide-GDP ribazoletransferase
MNEAPPADETGDGQDRVGASRIGPARLFLTALQYFTRLPMPAWTGHGQAQLEGVVRYFPAVGWIVGGIAAAVLWLTAWILPAPLPVLLSTAAGMWLTGAFHEDGLADTIDGLGGSAVRERALEIMKDSRVGTFGVLALVMTVFIKLAALNAMPTLSACVALVAGHSVSRWCSVVIVWRRSYAGNLQQSRAKPAARSMTPLQFSIATLFGLLPAVLCGMPAIAGIAFAAVTLAWLLRWFTQRLGGYTGDTLGATQQLTEVSFYLALLAAWKFY